MPRLALACLLALLVSAPVAEAKGYEFRLCGSSGCKPLQASVDGLYGVRTLSAPAVPGPYFELRGFSRQGREVGRWAYVPGAHALWRRYGSMGPLPGGTWTALDAREDAAWRRATRGLEPFRTPVVREGTLDGRPVADPASYLDLYAAPARVTSYTGTPKLLVLLSGRPTPWTGPDAGVDFYPRQGVIVTGATALLLPRIVADRIRRGVSLGPAA